MDNDLEKKNAPANAGQLAQLVEEGREARTWSPWFLGGVGLSFLALCSVVLLALLVVSVAMNTYLAWELSGLELVVRVPAPTPTIEGVEDTPVSRPIVVITAEPRQPPTRTPEPTATPEPASPLPPPATATPLPPPTPTPLPSPTPTFAPIDTDLPELQQPPTAVPLATVASSSVVPVPDQPQTSGPTTQGAVMASTNSYKLIPLIDGRDSRPAAQHADLNLKLRDPQPSTASARLVDYTGFDDANAPKLSDVFDPVFVRAYTVYDWDWNCNCKGKLKDDGFLVGIKTTPGEPVYIPTKQQDIWQGKYYAVVLYASEDSLTFVYAREGTVANAYAVHYQGLQTDPNLLATYRQSTGTELPGLTLDTPVGIATDELIVGIRDNGTFMDTRSRKDWWD